MSTSHAFFPRALRTAAVKALTTTLVAGFCISAGIATTASAQNYRIGGKETSMTLSGTSTLHDWKMVARAFTVDARIDVSTDAQLTGLQSLTMTLPVHSLKSDHDAMTENAYDALKADDFKNIVFHMTSAKVNSLGPRKAQILATGNLTIAGATKTVTLNATAVVGPDGSIACTGSVPIKLSDFKIDRPSFMLGTMKVGDAMTLNYSLQLVK